MGTPSYLLTLLYFGGVIATFIGERLISSGSLRVVSAAGVVMVIAATVLRVARANKAQGETRQVERAQLLIYAIGMAALLVYFLQSDLAASLFGKPLDRSSPRFAVVLQVLYPALLLGSLIPMLFVELSYASMARAPILESGRVRDAMLSGFGLAGCLVFAFSFSYVATERDKKLDLSHFRTARPGESSRKIVRTLSEPVQVSLFYPPANDVRGELETYFKDLSAENKLLQVNSFDYAIDPSKAKEMSVSGNGVVVVQKGARKELLSIGTELESARSQLRNLDKEVQKRLLLVARPQRTVYLVSGHGERSTSPQADTDKRLTIRDLKELLGQQGHQVKDLGAAEGLAADVPSDASLVMIIGPQKPLFPEEVAALGRYLDRNGRLFIALDPEDKQPQKDLLAMLGLTYQPVLVANDQIYARRFNQPSDKTNIATGSYSSHPAVTTLGRLGMRAPMVLFGAGFFEEIKGHDKTVTIDWPVRAHPMTWNDINGNFAFDGPAETRKGWEISAAVVKKKPEAKPGEEGRVLLLGDSDGLGDGVLGNPGNAYFVLDGTKWLIGDEAISGEVSSEVDIPLAHTHKQDLVWFYGTIFLAPAMAVAAGWLATRRRRPAVPKRRNA